MLSESDKATLPVLATVFDKLNQEYKKYLDAEQSYAMVSSRSGERALCPAPWRGKAAGVGCREHPAVRLAAGSSPGAVSPCNLLPVTSCEAARH